MIQEGKSSGSGRPLTEGPERTMLNLVDIVGEYVQLTREGESHYVGQCPFCLTQGSLILSVDNPYWSLDKQGWACLHCGAEGDRYDFVARIENVSRADAILMIAHYTNTREPFPHARFKVPGGAAEAETPAAPAAKWPEAVLVERRPPKFGGMDEADHKELMTRLVKFRNIIPSYEGAAVQNDASRQILFSDSEFPFSAELGELADMLWPLLANAGTVFPEPGRNRAKANTLSLASEEFAILGHKFGRERNDLMLLVVRLGNPSELPVARLVVNSVFPVPE